MKIKLIRILSVTALFLMLVTGYSNCSPLKFNSSGKGMYGGEVGNPMAPSADLLYAMCSVLSRCQKQISLNDCITSSANVTGAGPLLGVPSGSTQTFSNLQTQEQNGTLSANAAATNACTTEINSLNCSAPAVKNAYTATSTNPYSGIVNMIPTYPGGCNDVYSSLQISPAVVTLSPAGTQNFTAAGGAPPYKFTVVSGAGQITVAGSYTAPAAASGDKIRVTDASGHTSDAVVTVGAPSATWSAEYQGPLYRGFTQPVYDSVQKKILWYGPSQSLLYTGGYSGGMWTYDSTAHLWTEEWDRNPDSVCPGDSPTAGPGDRNPFRQMAYDSSRGRLWLHNGECYGYNPTLAVPQQGPEDTLYFDSQNFQWTDVTSIATPSTGNDRAVSAMVYDSSRDKIILFGGELSGNYDWQTWELDPSTSVWTPVTTTGITSASAMADNGMVYDSVNQKVIIFGGTSNACLNGCNWTWEYDPVTAVWQQNTTSVAPPASAHPALAYDSTRGVAWLYNNINDIWTYDASTHVWTKQTGIMGGPDITAVPDAKELVYDAGADKLILLAYDQNQGIIGVYELSLTGVVLQ